MKGLIAGIIIGFILSCIVFRMTTGTCFEWVDADSDAPQCKIYWRIIE